MKRAWQVAFLIALFCIIARAETGLQDVVRLVQTRYNARHHGVPGLWIAKPFMIGSGVGHLKIQQFEQLTIPAEEMKQFGGEIDRALGPDWSRVVEASSKHDGEWTVIYMRTHGSGLKLLIVNSERHDGVTLMQMALSDKASREWVDDTTVAAKKNRSPKSMGLFSGN